MKNFFSNVLKKNNLAISEFLIIIILCSLALPRIINSIAIGLFFIFSLFLFLKEKNYVFHFNRLSILFIVFFLYSSSTIFWSIDFQRSTNSISAIAAYFLIPLAFGLNPEVFKFKKVIYAFTKGISIIALFMLFKAFYNFFLTGDYKVFFYHNLSANVDDINAIYFSVFVSFSLLFLLIKEKTKLDKRMIVFLMIILVLLSSKTILTVSLLLICLIIRKKIVFYKKWFLVALSLFLLSLVFFKKRIEHEIYNSNLSEILTKKTFGWQYKWSGTGIRTLQIRVFNELVKEDTVLFQGYGLNAAKKRIQDKHKELKLYSGMIGIDLHNQYLQFILEVGVLGLIIYLIMFFLLLKKATINKDILLLSFVILMIFVCTTEIFLARQRGMIFFIMMSLILYKSSKKLAA